ncbi:MAG: lytic murein transglycosylase [Pseudomonadales bacterium]|nr:lytic murein transglycosylase [Pseudomonadales bacterium]
MTRILISFTFFLCQFSLASIAQGDDRPPFDTWLAGIKQQAIERGISAQTASVLDDIEPDPRVLGFDRKQPEFVQTFEQYLTARVTDARIKTAREQFRQHRALLSSIGDKYGVDPQFIVAFWGLESSFGRYQGKYSVVRSLATLAYDPRRTTFFTKELFAALRILDEGHVTPDAFTGGWAGAMGQNQFLPSSFLRYAQDFDGDGKKNIWNDEADVWASIANYLSQNGWKKHAGWGTRVQVPASFDFDAVMPEKVASGCTALKEHTRKMPAAKWKALGVRFDPDGLNSSAYALVVPDDGETVTYLVGGNFRSILSYNCANKYAVSIGLLADLVAEGGDDD